MLLNDYKQLAIIRVSWNNPAEVPIPITDSQPLQLAAARPLQSTVTVLIYTVFCIRQVLDFGFPCKGYEAQVSIFQFQ
jgi:hypothetical protein